MGGTHAGKGRAERSGPPCQLPVEKRAPHAVRAPSRAPLGVESVGGRAMPLLRRRAMAWLLGLGLWSAPLSQVPQPRARLGIDASSRCVYLVWQEF